MNLKKSYVEKYGYERVITNRNSPLTFVEMDMLKLEKDHSYTINEVEKEFVFVILSGFCSIKGDDFEFPKVGNRASSLEVIGAESVYVGKNKVTTITALDGDVKIAVCKAPAPVYYPPVYIKASDVKISRFGKGNYVRDVAFTFPETVKANYLYIGEYWVDDGFWASFPPHKHDVDSELEGALDEIYYYEFDKPQGFGIQMVYTEDKTIDEAYRIMHGDSVEIPRGYHPMAVAPGYKNYTLWIMAGPRRGLLSTQQDCHKWINNR